MEKMKMSNVWSRNKVDAKIKNRINPMTRTKKKSFGTDGVILLSIFPTRENSPTNFLIICFNFHPKLRYTELFVRQFKFNIKLYKQASGYDSRDSDFKKGK